MNHYLTKKELKESLRSLIAPLRPFYGKGDLGKLKFGSHGTVYSEETQGVEAFLRPLWGLGPYFTSEEDELLAAYIQGIVAGTNPESEDYWGEVTDFDQLIVEMASLSTCLLLNRENVWEKFTAHEQSRLSSWLYQVNEREIPRNNWHFFRILVNLALKKCGQLYSQERIDSDFEVINSFYCENGWYFDGEETQFDYYISFAIHFYSLIYAHFMSEEDPKRVEVIKQRATAFAQTFKYWFDSEGEALPFGRSLTYRFAQVSFFSALVFADVEALPWGEIKGLISRHLTSWMNKEIFSADGLLTVGYHYENLVFAEGYNAYGSPYWALKTFLLLAVADDHPYWKAEALPLTIQNRSLAVPESKNFYQYNEDLTHLQAFPAGQFVTHQNHPQSKYSKFVYSTKFGFSVPKTDYWYYEGNYDSTLALAKDDHYFRPKARDTSYKILGDRIIHVWNPWQDVFVKSTIIPLETCHIRIHEIETKERLAAYDGGFSVPFQGVLPVSEKLRVVANSEIGCSSIEAVLGYQEARVVRTEPNTNLFYKRTMLPYVVADLAPGKHLLISLVSGLMPNERMNRPVIEQNKEKICIKQNDKRIEISV